MIFHQTFQHFSGLGIDVPTIGVKVSHLQNKHLEMKYSLFSWVMFDLINLPTPVFLQKMTSLFLPGFGAAAQKLHDLVAQRLFLGKSW